MRHLELVGKRSCRLWTWLIISIVLSWFSHCVCGKALNRGLRAGEPSILLCVAPEGAKAGTWAHAHAVWSG